MANTLQIKRGQKTNIPVLSTGEYGYAEDTQEVFIGTGSSNIRVLTEDDLYTDSDVNSHLSGGTGIDYSSGTISIDSTVMRDLSDDTAPQLGGDLENNGHLIKNAITLNANSIDVAYTIPTGYNAMSVGPLDINSDITINDNSTWNII